MLVLVHQKVIVQIRIVIVIGSNIMISPHLRLIQPHLYLIKDRVLEQLAEKLNICDYQQTEGLERKMQAYAEVTDEDKIILLYEQELFIIYR